MFLVYQITNLVNHKIYIGKHETDNLNDSYMGSGTAIESAIRKYGRDQFVKEILFSYDTEHDAFQKEAELVNEDFVARKDTYNMKLGGTGSWHHRKGIRLSMEHRAKISAAIKGVPKPRSKESCLKQSQTITGRGNPFFGKSHSDETRSKIGSREYTNKISIQIDGVVYASTKEACAVLGFGVNYLIPIVKELKESGAMELPKYHKMLRKSFTFSLSGV